MRAALWAALLLGVAAAAPPRTARASHILVKDKAQAQQLKKQLEGSADAGLFAELAQKHSLCNSAKSGGDLGSWEEGSMVSAFDRSVFSQKGTGGIIGPVETQFGFHLIQVHERTGMAPKRRAADPEGGVQVADLAAFTELVQGGKDVWAVEFFSEMCGSCTEFAPNWLAFTKAEPAVRFARVSIDDDGGRSIAAALGVLDEGIPNVRVFNGRAPRGVTLTKGEASTADELLRGLAEAVSPSKKGKSGFFRKASP
eukprot:TRINITY_DN34306_c0_g1_i1.p1 TRINITY_DN34306_c0_g1~~TRINITY_DN34306_c0_g1_i1.p1  ORF type:complete len:281 (+),score=96.54 TRINITY_DN34306_c0_g1_i1:81-845(+)